MDNVELSPATRWGMIATGLLQGLVCYLLIAWLAGKNLSWIVYGVPVTVAFSSVLLFSVISFKQKRLWGWLALVFIATLGMSGWLKWQIDGMNHWRAEKALWDFGCYLLLWQCCCYRGYNKAFASAMTVAAIAIFTSQYGITYLYYW